MIGRGLEDMGLGRRSAASEAEDDEDEEDDDVGPLSFFNDSFNVQQRGTVQSSFSSGFYTDDLEE